MFNKYKFRFVKLKSITMHILKENLPVTMDAPGMKMTLQMGWGGMGVSYNEFGPMDKKTSALMFEGFPDKNCPIPHWGYMIKGSMHLQYKDGKEEVIHAGEVFYLPGGHTGWSDDGMSWIEFSPEKEMKEISDLMAKK